MTGDYDDDTDSWDRWWQLPGFPPTPADNRQRPRGTPARRSATERMARPPASFVVQRLLYSASASGDESRRLLCRLREAIAGRWLVAAVQCASEMCGELAHHDRKLEAARLHAMADCPAYEDEIAEARAAFDLLIAECEPWLALAPTSAEHIDRDSWLMRVEHAEQVARASSEPAAAKGQVIQLWPLARREISSAAVIGAAAGVGGEAVLARIEASLAVAHVDVGVACCEEE